MITGKAKVFQARAAHDAEQDQVIDIHEITERTDDDGGLEDLAQDGFWFSFGVANLIYELRLTRVKLFRIVNRKSAIVNSNDTPLP